MTQPDVYLLAAHEPYTDPRHPVPINATIVHAATLLHPQVPQPDGGMIYRCLTEFPDRRPHQIVPVSTLTYELDGGRLWPQVADWMTVVDALVTLARAGACDAMPLGLTQLQAFLLAQGPTTDSVCTTPTAPPTTAAPRPPAGPRRPRHPPAPGPRRGTVLARRPPRPRARTTRRPALPALPLRAAVTARPARSAPASAPGGIRR